MFFAKIITMKKNYSPISTPTASKFFYISFLFRAILASLAGCNSRNQYLLIKDEGRVPGFRALSFCRLPNADLLITQYETLCTLSLIEKRWNLSALNSQDANAHPFENAFDFCNYAADKSANNWNWYS